MSKKKRKTYPPGYYYCVDGKRLDLFDVGIPASRNELIIYSSGFNSFKKWLPGKGRTLNWTIYYNYTAGANLQIADRSIDLTPDEIILIPGDYSFKRSCNGNLIEHLWICFFYSQNVAPEQDIPIVIKVNDTLKCLLRDLRALLEQNDLNADKCYHCSQALLYTIMTMPEIKWSAPIPDVLIKVLSQIKNNIRSKLTTQKLAEHAKMSPKTFYRTFKKHFGKAPGEYIIEQRIRYAENLISSSDMTFDEIAELSGFNYRESFSRTFKKVIGVSPNEFKRRLKISSKS